MALVMVGLVNVAASSELPDLCKLSPLPKMSGPYAGTGSGEATVGAGGCAMLHFNSSTGMAADFVVATFDVTPLKKYIVRMALKTQNLSPTPRPPQGCIEERGGALGVGLDNQTACSGAYLTGAPYVSYTDGHGRADGWFPAYGTHAPPTSDWHNISLVFAPPTTAAQATVHIAYGAHQYAEGAGGRMHGGTATGEAWVRDMSVAPAPAPPSTVLPASFHVPTSEKNLSAAVELAAQCLHNSQISGNFTVGSDYVISGNLSPDLAFGLLGTRRLAHGSYMKTWESTWLENRNLMNAQGQIGKFQRVMSHVLWPLGVDAIFSFSGNVSYLHENLPYVDKVMGYLKSLSAEDALPCFPKDLMKLFPPGVDWNDWQDSRAYGATTTFATWYVRCLRRFAALHAEFGSKAKSVEYTAIANKVTDSVRSLWLADAKDGPHFATNARHSEDCSHNALDDGVWVDDQLWAVVNGVATEKQSQAIKEWLDNRTVAYESQPTRWCSKGGAANPVAKERYTETWFGRLGLGDVLMRYNNFSQPEFGLTLLRRIANAFVGTENIMESYTMAGTVGTDPGTDYLEHCAGFVWALVDGPLGVNFDSDMEAVATISPQLSPSWDEASAYLVFRGVNVSVHVSHAGKTTLSSVAGGVGAGKSVKIRVVEGGKPSIVTLSQPSV